MQRNLLLITSFIFIVMTACYPEKTDSKCEVQTVFENITARKSERKYQAKAVEKEKVQLMLKAAMAAPSGKDTRPWEFIVVEDRETLNKMGDGLPYAKMLKEASLAIVVCGDTTKSFYWYLDCALAGQNILLSAQALGLGAVWTATYPYPERMDVVKEALNLPEHINSLCVIPVGYPLTESKPKNKWDESRIHYNKW